MENKLDEELKEITKYNICDDLIMNKLNIMFFVNLISDVIDTKEKLEEFETILISIENDSSIADSENIPIEKVEAAENKVELIKLKTIIADSFLKQKKYYEGIMVLERSIGLSELWIQMLNILKQQIKANDEKFNTLLERL